MPRIDPDRTPVYFPSANQVAHERKLSSVFHTTSLGPEKLSPSVDEGPFEGCTPSMPLPLVRRCLDVEHDTAGDVAWPDAFRPQAGALSWEPPPLRKLLESIPPPPSLPARSDHELSFALTDSAKYGLVWSEPAFATTATLTIDWDTTMDVKPKKRAYLGWIGVGAVYAAGITTMIAFERDRVVTASLADVAAVHTSDAMRLPTLTKQVRQGQAATIATATPIVLKRPLRIVGFVTDPPTPPTPPTQPTQPVREQARQPSSAVSLAKLKPAADADAQPSGTPKPQAKPSKPKPKIELQEINLARLRVVVGTKAAQASACGDGEHSGRTRVMITFAPSGRATSAVLGGGKFNGTQVGSCIASIMGSAQIPAFAGEHTTVLKTVTVRKKR